jgi:hypothetical protein
MSNYHREVWERAKRDAEADVMRLTATPPGGRKDKEPLLDYVERVKQMQGAAIARWMTACAELEAASKGGEA